MPTRDPQTGQFVSGEAGGWNNLEPQFVSTTLDVKNDAAAGGYTHEQYQSFEPLGGLQRNEFAELVAIIGTESARADAIGGNDIPGSCAFHYELSLDPEMFGGREEVTSENIDGVTGIDTSAVVAVEPDILRHGHLRVSAGFNDTVNGPGGGGHVHADRPVDHNYRDLLGGGPVLDRHDQLYQHVDRSHVGDTNASYSLHTDWTLFWNVFEE